MSWRIDDGEMTVDVTVPDGAEATVELPLHPAGAVEQAGPGTHTWRYPLPESFGSRPAYTMDTPLNTIADDPQVWPAVSAVFATYFPGVPIDGSAPEAAAMSLSTVLQFIPGVPDGLEDALRAALTPEDTTTR